MSKVFELTNYQLSVLQDKRKVYSVMYNNLKRDDAVFKLSNGTLDFALVGSSGLIKTTINIDYTGDTQYFSVDYNKFETVLQKFILEEKVNFSLTESLLKICTDSKKDLVNLQITTFDEKAPSAVIIDTYVDDYKSKYMNSKHCIKMTDDIINNTNLFNYLFDSSNKVNAIGLSKTDVMYSDRSIVVKSTLSEVLSDDLFDSLPEDDNYVYLHADTLKLLSLLYNYNNEFYFDNSYDVIFWNDDNTSIVYQNDNKNVVLPTEEQFEGIKPQNKEVLFNVNINELNSVLDFFNGIYVETGWKPLEFKCVAGKTVEANYKNPLAEASKEFQDVTCNYTGSFLIDADTLKKIINKEKDVVADDTDVVFIFDEENSEAPAPGILIKIGDKFESVMSKLNEN